MVRADVIYKNLICPVCRTSLFASEDGKSLLCKAPKAHCFDFSSSGYINFALGKSGAGDSREAVRARRDFLSLGKYEPVAVAMSDILEGHVGKRPTVVDAGCGEGYYARALLSRGALVLGFDISKDAVNMAAKAAKSMQNDSFFGVASVFELPLSDASADAVINVFAPCVESEYTRVLREGGVLAVAYAGPDHLLGLKRALYDTTYANESRADMPQGLELIEERRVRFSMRLESERDIQNLFEMTPYYWRTSPKDKEKLRALSELTTDVDIIIAVYRKK